MFIFLRSSNIYRKSRGYVDNRPDDDLKLLIDQRVRSSLPSPLTIILHMSKIGNDTKTVFWFVIMIVLATKWELSLLFKFKSKPLEPFRLEETDPLSNSIRTGK